MCKPKPSKRLGFWFSAYQVLKWRGGDVAYTGWFQPTHMPPPTTAISPPPSPQQTTTTQLEPWQIRTVTPLLMWTEKRQWTSYNDALRMQMDGNGWYTPLPYPEEVTSEHGSSAASVPHQSCTTHPVKNSWGDRIYGTLFPWLNCFEKFYRLHPTVWLNHLESKMSHLWYYAEP